MLMPCTTYPTVLSLFKRPYGSTCCPWYIKYLHFTMSQNTSPHSNLIVMGCGWQRNLQLPFSAPPCPVWVTESPPSPLLVPDSLSCSKEVLKWTRSLDLQRWFTTMNQSAGPPLALCWSAKLSFWSYSWRMANRLFPAVAMVSRSFVTVNCVWLPAC